MFLLALVAVSSRAFLPSDMASPAPITSEELGVMVTKSKQALSFQGGVPFTLDPFSVNCVS
jgi:hypothetical protein